VKISYVQPHSLEATAESSRDLATFEGYPNFHCEVLNRLGYSSELLGLTHDANITFDTHEFGHQIIQFPITVGSAFGTEFSLSLLNYLLRSDSDLIHIRGYAQYNVLPFLPILSRAKPVVVQHMGEAHTYSQPNLKKRVAIRLLRGADMVTALDANEMEELVTAGFPESRVHHLPNAVNTKLFYPVARSGALSELNLDPTRRYVLYVGRVTPPKNVPTLVEALAEIVEQHPDVVLLIVGDGPQSELSKVRRRIEAAGLEAHVRLEGHIPQKELLYYYNGADVAVFPSSAEGLGMVALEAGACKTPIVGTPAHESSILKSERNCLIADPGEVSALASAIGRVLTNQALTTDLAETVRTDVLEKYHPDVIAETLSTIYTKAQEHNRAATY
jgi:glycosyltransferase involved in cell wall biosynthesis